MKTPIDKEYIFLKCNSCNERTKIAKDKGAGWVCRDTWYKEFLPEFLLFHVHCGDLELEFE